MRTSLSSVIKSVQQPICRYTPEIIKKNKMLTGVALVALAEIYDLYIRELWLSPEKKFKRMAPVEQFNHAKELYIKGDYLQARKYLHLYLERYMSLSIFQFCKHLFRMSVNFYLYKPELSRELCAMYAYASLCLKGQGGAVDDVAARTYFEKINKCFGSDCFGMLGRGGDLLRVSAFYNYAQMCKDGKGGDQDSSATEQFNEMLVRLNPYGFDESENKIFLENEPVQLDLLSGDRVLELKRDAEKAYFSQVLEKNAPSDEETEEIKGEISALLEKCRSFEEAYKITCSYKAQRKAYHERMALIGLENSIVRLSRPNWDQLLKVRHRLTTVGNRFSTGIATPENTRKYYAKIMGIPAKELSEESLKTWIKVCNEYIRMCRCGVGGERDENAVKEAYENLVLIDESKLKDSECINIIRHANYKLRGMTTY